uniref:DUF6598 domain-containing protein n=1 Tax=Oryza nivara TaxID=4536 RepID=A0A0E0GV99_ORYNI
MAKRRAESELEQVEAEAEAEAEAEKNGRRAAGSQDGVNRALILDCSKHSDGSIYSGDDFLAQVLQALKEAMMLSNPTNCRPHMWACNIHEEQFMMQIFSLKLSNITATVDGPVHLYGYFAVRDHLDPLRNYIFNRTRDDPFIMGQDNGVDSDNSLIPMPGPKRGIGNQARVLIEFDIKIKNGETRDDDFQLIDGAIICSEFVLPNRVFTQRIEGDCGAVDISLALLHSAVEATVQVSISQVHGNGFSLSLYSYTSRIPEKIQLFDGFISKPCDLNRFVVAVVVNTPLILIFKIDKRDGSDHVPGCCAFKARTHGYEYDMQELKLESELVLVEAEAEAEAEAEKNGRRAAGSQDGVNRAFILECSKHSDGSIYSGDDFWHMFYKVADTRETRMEAMMLSNPTNCRPHMWACKAHSVQFMMQIFSLKLSNITAAVDGPVHLYGYFAVRDHLDPLRNYIFNRTRDDPFIMG